MKVFSFCPVGFDGVLVAIEIEIRRGIPGIDIVGLPDTVLRESRQRVRAAIRNSGFEVPRQRILLNLSPAGLRKTGARYDLALAVAILAASGQLARGDNETVLALGELSLDGSIVPVLGSYAALAVARQAGIEHCVCSAQEEFSVRSGAVITLCAISSLSQLRDLKWAALAPAELAPAELAPAELAGVPASGLQLQGSLVAPNPKRLKAPVKQTGPSTAATLNATATPSTAATLSTAATPSASEEHINREDLSRLLSSLPDISWMSGLARIALAASLAGGHHMLLLGSPGTGKSSMLDLAARLELPVAQRHQKDLLRIMNLHSTNFLGEGARCMPVRRPHSSTSQEGMFGGGRSLRPGELSLAHGGLLLLDEIFDFAPKVLAGLRAPMEHSSLAIGRADMHTRFPCEFTLWAAGNLCPCGGLGMLDGFCVCSPRALAAHWARLGAAFEDRFDIRIVFDQDEDGTVEEELPAWAAGSSADLWEAVLRCRELNAGNGRLRGLELAGGAGNVTSTPAGNGTAAGNGRPSALPGQSLRGWTSLERLTITLAALDGRAEARQKDRDLALRLRSPEVLSGTLGVALGV